MRKFHENFMKMSRKFPENFSQGSGSEKIRGQDPDPNPDPK